jgi:hypothetical protein
MKYLSIFVVIIFFGCNKNKATINEDIETIVDVVAAERSLIHETTTPLSPELYKKQANNKILSSNIRIPFLMTLKYKNEKIFDSKDSIYFLQQNDMIMNFKLSKKNYGDLLVNNSPNPFIYKLSIPLFSKNHNYAFIHADHVIPGHSGSGYVFLLKKIDGKWIIIFKTSWWQS